MATEKSVMAVIRAARPNFRNNHDKVAFAVHASFLASGYMLTATGPPAFSDTAFSSSTDEVGIEGWNELEDEYAFIYTNPEKGPNSGNVLVKCLKMNDKLLVDALADQGSEPIHLEIDVEDYVKENGESNYSAQYNDFEKLMRRLNSEILSKLDGSSKSSASSRPARWETSERSTRNRNEPGFGIAEPSGLQIHPSGVVIPPVNSIGGSDLFPGPGAGMYPTRGGHGGGDMLVGPNDPRWFGEVGREPGFPGGQPGVPPGARFDPYGPPGVPGFEPSRFVRCTTSPPHVQVYFQPLSKQINPRGGGGTHPDLEYFGSGSDFI